MRQAQGMNGIPPSEPRTQLYAVVLKFELVVDTPTPNDDPTREIAIHVVAANDEEGARRRGEAIGRARENSYLNVDGETVRDVFHGITDVVYLLSDRLEEGCEVYYKLYGDEGCRLA